MSSKKAAELLKTYKLFMSTTGFDQVLKHLKVIDVLPGKCLTEFVVQPQNLSPGGALHGGFTAAVVDNVTTFASFSNEEKLGVSIDLHVSYLKAAKEGDVIVVDAKTEKAGKTLAYLECELRNKENGSIIAKGSQTKFVGEK